MSSTSKTEIVLGAGAFNMPLPDLWRTLGRSGPFACAYLGGTFDLPHRGHFALLARARRLAERVVISLNSDEFAGRYKRRPIMPLADRMAVFSHCRLVDQVIVNEGDEDSKPSIVFAGADCVIHGDDWQGESLLRQMHLTSAWLAERGVTLVIVPYGEFGGTTGLLKSAGFLDRIG